MHHSYSHQDEGQECSCHRSPSQHQAGRHLHQSRRAGAGWAEPAANILIIRYVSMCGGDGFKRQVFRLWKQKEMGAGDTS